jgi:cell division protein FtsQ
MENLEDNNPQKNNGSGLIFSLIFLLVIFTSLLLFLSPWKQITKIKVQSLQHNYQDVLNATGISNGMNAYLLVNQSDTINNRLKNIDGIKSVSYKVKGTTLSIKVNEKIVYGYVSKNNKLYAVNENGQNVNVVNKIEVSVPIYANFKPNTNAFRDSISQYFKTDQSVRYAIGQIIYAPNYANPNRIALVMNDGNLVYALPENFAKKMDFYSQMVGTMQDRDIKTGVIDLTGDGFARSYAEDDHDLIKQANDPKKPDVYQPPKKEKKSSSSSKKTSSDSSEKSSEDSSASTSKDN